MVWVLSVTETIAYAALFYCFAVMVVPMREDLDATTAQLSAALSLAIAVNGLAALPVGRWLDRSGARWVMSGGSLLGGVSVAAWSQAQDLPQLYLAFAGMGLAGAAVLYEPAFAVVNVWFRRDRNGALLILTVVAGLSSTIFLPVSQLLVDGYGWRTAVLVLAGLLGACAVPQALLLRRSPADLGLQPDGDGTEPAGRPVQGSAGLPPVGASPGGETADLAGMWRRPAVRRLTLSSVLETVAVTVVAVHLVAYLRDTGAGAGAAAATAGTLGIMSVTGRIVLTALARRVGLARLAAGIIGGQAVGVLALLAAPRPAGLVLFVVLFGAGFGIMTIARAALLGVYVPQSVFASVSGGVSLASNAGRLAAPVSAGILIGSAGYGAAFAAVGACSLGAAALLLQAERAHARGGATATPDFARDDTAGARTFSRAGGSCRG